jgi:para-aminobenzoate synthetase/4-amino-4-deoxychorismate lyase
MTPFDLPQRTLLLDDARPGGRAMLFRDPIDWIEVTDPADVPAALARIDRAVVQGHWVAGAFAFELGYLLEPKLRSRFRPSPDPLIAVGIYKPPQHGRGAELTGQIMAGRSCTIGPPGPALTLTGYQPLFDLVRDYIAAGDVYQVNLTFPLDFQTHGDIFARLGAWRMQARAGYGAVLRLDDRDILSFSPELFLASYGDGIIRTRPMKGTTQRGADPDADANQRATLVADEKQRAENLMIVDLLRNDLSRVCDTGTVRVTDLFTIETYPTLHTMTSGIEGQLRDGVTPSDLLRALFPCGSVTGAPKVRAMEIIAEAESATRGVYCGAIGFIGPGLEMNLNVAIRTMVHERDAATLRMGIGSGVIYDSVGPAEYDECLLKARFVSDADQIPDLLETMRWQQDTGFVLLEDHLRRLARAAIYFETPFDEAAIRRLLDELAEMPGPFMRRIRLLLDPAGAARIESTALDARMIEPAAALATNEASIDLIVAETRLSSSDSFSRHKTTRRAVYDLALAEAQHRGATEAILLNEHGRIADGSFTTIFLQMEGALLTPPPSEGALDGVLKQALLRDQSLRLRETPLTLTDLRAADAIFVGNSVRGLLRARLL